MAANEYKYYFLNRPPMIGTHPTENQIEQKPFYPVQLVPNTQRNCWGIVTYTQPLSFDQVWRYELFPADENEQNRYFDWRDENEK